MFRDIMKQVLLDNKLFRRHRAEIRASARRKERERISKIKKWKKEGTDMREHLKNLVNNLVKKID